MNSDRRIRSGRGRLTALRHLLLIAVAGTLTAALSLVWSPTASARAFANCSAGYVGLTYDDGPNPSNTMTLLNTLKQYGVRATLFNIGQNAQNNLSLVQAEQAANMWIGNHSWTHPHRIQMSSTQNYTDLQRTQQVIQQATGTAPKLFRPPYGETNGTLKSIEQQLGLTEIIWDVDSQDWNGASTAQIVQAAGRLQNGQIILMHDQYATTIAAIPQIVANLQSRNLCPGMISPATGRAVAPDGMPTDPPSTPTPTVTPSTPPQGGGACTATIRTINSWQGGFQSEVTVHAGNSAINGWTVSWTWPSGQTVNNLWNGQSSGSGSSMVVHNVAWNGSIGANGSTTFGFVGNGSAATPTATCTSP
jgi:endo-1,4-beta-xylanase